MKILNLVLLSVIIKLVPETAFAIDTTDMARAKITNWVDTITAYQCTITDGSGLTITDFYYLEGGVKKSAQRVTSSIAERFVTFYLFDTGPNRIIVLPNARLKKAADEDTLLGTVNKTVSFVASDKSGIAAFFGFGQNLSTGEDAGNKWIQLTLPASMSTISSEQGYYDPKKATTEEAEKLLNGANITAKLYYQDNGKVSQIRIIREGLTMTLTFTFDTFDLNTVKASFPPVPNGLALSPFGITRAIVEEIRASPLINNL
jgi:hypothetical protein